MVTIKELDSDKIYSIKEIDLWFNENWQNYNWISDRWRCKHCPTQEKLNCICIEPDDEWKFLKLYEAMDEILRFHRKEMYFKNELIEYYKAKNSEIDLKTWAAKNERIGKNDCDSFSTKYLKEDKDYEEGNPLRVYGSSELELFAINKIRDELGRGGHKTKLDFEVFIQKQDFRYGIEFIKIFKEVLTTLKEIEFNQNKKIKPIDLTINEIKNGLITSCIDENPEFFTPFLRSPKLKTGYDNNIQFYTALKEMLNCAKVNSISKWKLRIVSTPYFKIMSETPIDENDDCYELNFHDNYHHYPRLSIMVKENKESIYLEFPPL